MRIIKLTFCKTELSTRVSLQTQECLEWFPESWVQNYAIDISNYFQLCNVTLTMVKTVQWHQYRSKQSKRTFKYIGTVYKQSPMHQNTSKRCTMASQHTELCASKDVILVTSLVQGHRNIPKPCTTTPIHIETKESKFNFAHLFLVGIRALVWP